MGYDNRVQEAMAGYAAGTADIELQEKEKIEGSRAIRWMNNVTAMVSGAKPMIGLVKGFQPEGFDMEAFQERKGARQDARQARQDTREANRAYKKWFKETHGNKAWRQGVAGGIQSGKNQWRHKKNELVGAYLAGVTTWDTEVDPNTNAVKEKTNNESVPLTNIVTNENVTETSSGNVVPWQGKPGGLLQYTPMPGAGEGGMGDVDVSGYKPNIPIYDIEGVDADIVEHPDIDIDTTHEGQFTQATIDTTNYMPPDEDLPTRGKDLTEKFVEEGKESLTQKEKDKPDSALTQDEWEAKYWGRIGKDNPYTDDWYWGRMFGRKPPSGGK